MDACEISAELRNHGNLIVIQHSKVLRMNQVEGRSVQK